MLRPWPLQKSSAGALGRAPGPPAAGARSPEAQVSRPGLLKSFGPLAAAVIVATLAGVLVTTQEAKSVVAVFGGLLAAVLVFLAPLWAVIAYLIICSSPFFGIHDYIELGEYAAAGLLVLLLMREMLRGLRRRDLSSIPAVFYALAGVFLVAGLTAFLHQVDGLFWAREQFQYLPILLGVVVARNLSSRRQVLALVLVSGALTLLALPFEAYQVLLSRSETYAILTGESFALSEGSRLSLPHFAVMNPAMFAALLASWLLIPKPKRWKLLNYALAVSVPVAMLFGQSRVWMLMALVGLMLPLLLTQIGPRLQLFRRLLLIGVLATSGLYLGYKAVDTFNPKLGEALATRLGLLLSPAQDESVLIRLEGARYLLTIVAESPLVGHGLGYSVSMHPYVYARHTESISAFDNGNLALLIKFGAVGTLIFLWFFWFLGAMAYRVLLRPPDPLARLVAATFLSGLLCLLLLNFLYSGLNRFENTNFLGIWAGLVFWWAARTPSKKHAG